MNKLTPDEIEILESFEKGEWVSKGSFTERKQQLQQYAKNTLNQKPVQIFVKEEDLIIIQTLASEKGISYQNLISNILHQYVSS